MNEPDAKAKPPKAPARNDGMSGNMLVGNVLVGLGLGWVAQHYFPGIKPWGYGVGLIVGFASGLWQLLKAEGYGKSFRPKPKRDDDGTGAPKP
jgi:F0F1-type ATP synthase assembly protein I